MIATGPPPPYVAVIFTSQQSDDTLGYDELAAEIARLAARQPGYLGVESAHTPAGGGITVSYWTDEDSARAWGRVAEHRAAQRLGRDRFYADYRLRVARVEHERGPRD